MIITKFKSDEEIKKILEPYCHICVIHCGTCANICGTSGPVAKEKLEDLFPNKLFYHIDNIANCIEWPKFNYADYDTVVTLACDKGNYNIGPNVLLTYRNCSLWRGKNKYKYINAFAGIYAQIIRWFVK